MGLLNFKLFNIRLNYRDLNPNDCNKCKRLEECSKMLSGETIQGKRKLNRVKHEGFVTAFSGSMGVGGR